MSRVAPQSPGLFASPPDDPRPAGRVLGELEGLSARYPSSREPPLSSVTLSVEAGELVAVLGPNGAGKSTLLRVLAGVLTPSAGTVRLFGAPLASLRRREVAREVAVVAQSEEIAFGYTVSDVVMMGRSAHQDAWMRSGAEDRAVSDLPGGEQKRVALARALAQTPKLMLLDEPTAFLDVHHQIALFDLLEEEVRGGLACVVVMHDMNLAAQYASRVALMKQGRLVAIGKVEEVMTYTGLRETFDSDLYVGVNDVTGARFFLPMRGHGRAREPGPGA